MAEYVYEFTNDIDLPQLQALFAQTDWTNRRSPAALQAMLEQTRVCLAVWQGERLVGFGRAITDDLFRAFVEDVIVAADCRGQGIGAAIVSRLLERLAHVEEITLNCHDHLIPFYERFGFTRTDMAYLHLWKGG